MTRPEDVARALAALSEQAAFIRQHEKAERERALGEQRRLLEAESLRQRLEEQRRYAQALAAQNDELTRTRAELERTNARLAEADRRKDEFIAILAHELRNPLAPLVTGIEVFRELACEDEVMEEALGAMGRQVDHLVRLIDDLLDVSRITSGKIELVREPVLLYDIIEQAIAISRPGIEERNHELCVELAEPVVVDADRVRLTQVVANLLNNAARYTGDAGLIEVTCRRDGDGVTLGVSDNGQGMSPELCARVFDMFVQGKAGGGGLGIGLTLVKRLTEMHGGRVRASSPGRGQGSRFEVWLPVTQDELVQPMSHAPTSAVEAAERLRVVLIDDSPDICLTMRTLLERWGHTVLEANTGAEGVDLVVAERPDVALVDIGLPDIEGYEVARRARALLGPSCPRLVAVSGFGQDADRRRALEAGFDDHVSKPAGRAELRRILRAR